jgi:hypothetical protein
MPRSTIVPPELDEVRRLYEDAIEEAARDAEAILDEAAKKAEPRRRFQVDSQGCTVIAYVDDGGDR